MERRQKHHGLYLVVHFVCRTKCTLEYIHCTVEAVCGCGCVRLAA